MLPSSYITDICQVRTFCPASSDQIKLVEVIKAEVEWGDKSSTGISSLLVSLSAWENRPSFSGDSGFVCTSLMDLWKQIRSHWRDVVFFLNSRINVLFFFNNKLWLSIKQVPLSFALNCLNSWKKSDLWSQLEWEYIHLLWIQGSLNGVRI